MERSGMRVSLYAFVRRGRVSRAALMSLSPYPLAGLIGIAHGVRACSR
jgi:hypothetical protein